MIWECEVVSTGLEKAKTRTVDVIIPTKKPGKQFLALLEKLSAQTVVPSRIIVMNTEEKYFERLTYGTHFMEKYQNVEVYHLSGREFDHGRTRNDGVRHSDADVFVCLTQDAVPQDDRLIEELLNGLSEKNAAVSYGRQLPASDAQILERFTRQFNYPDASCVKSKEDLERLGIKTYFCSNVCAAYDRKIFDSLGGFIRHTIFNEDMIYAAKAVQAGYRIVYAAKAQVVHSHNYTNVEQFKRNFDLGVSQADHPEIFDKVPSESEGIRMIKQTVQYLKEQKQARKIPALFVKSGFKFVGYRMGKSYRRLPRKLVLKCSMNRRYWER